MRKLVQVVGLILIVDGFITATFSKDYLSIWQTDRFGPEYRRFIDSYAALPTPTLRVIGFTEVLIGTTMMLLTAEQKRSRLRFIR